MTETFDTLAAAKPLPLLPLSYVRAPGPIGEVIAEAITHDRMFSWHKQERDRRLDLLQRRYGYPEVNDGE
jgi:hypothetical protein